MPSSLTPYQENIHYTKYARWQDVLGRRETPDEAVDRYIDYLCDRGGEAVSRALRERLRKAMKAQEVVGSMRALMTAGPALDRDEVAAYNCSYLTISRPQAFDEIMYLLMCGTGVGFSVERHHVEKLPVIPAVFTPSNRTITVRDSKYGWAEALRALVNDLYAGKTPAWDTSHVRAAGERLKTFGGRASGPAPLIALFNHVTATFTQAAGRRLTPKECHSIVTKIGDIVVVGGVRRSAEISLFSADDDEMMSAKSGTWDKTSPHFALANNSAVWTTKPAPQRFLRVMQALIESGAGEPGIFNREAAATQAGRSGRRDVSHEFGCNPCGEIILRDRQLCNLTEVIIRPDDTLDTLKRKVADATALGTLQSTLTNFKYLSPQWQRNCEEERLLGVSFTGIMDHPVMNGTHGPALLELWLDDLRVVAIEENMRLARKLGINASTAITCVKPSGNTSQRMGTSSGIHSRYSRYYIRRNRASKTDPVAQFLFTQGVPCEDENWHPETTWVFSWPQAAPEESIVRSEVTALDQLNLWLAYHEHWCEHKPSITVSVRTDEWMDVIAFCWRHWDKMSGVAFLPYAEDDHIYVQAPYEEITREQYEELVAQVPALDWSRLTDFEDDDHTIGSQELACTGGACEL